MFSQVIHHLCGMKIFLCAIFYRTQEPGSLHSSVNLVHIFHVLSEVINSLTIIAATFHTTIFTGLRSGSSLTRDYLQCIAVESSYTALVCYHELACSG